MSRDLTVSIVNYNHKERILACLESISHAAGVLDIDIHVVDNNSVDGSVDEIKRRYPQVKLTANTENVGFAKANNQVLSCFESRYCLITNPDIVALPGALEAMVAFMDSHPEAGAAGCKMLNHDRTIQYSCRRFPSVFTTVTRGLLIDSVWPISKMTEKYLMQDWAHDRIMPVDWLTGCCLLLRRTTLQEVGLLDERYFMYFEDVDLCYRINRNWKVYYLPHISMIHEYQHESRMPGNLKLKLHHARSAMQFFMKHGLASGRNGRGAFPAA